MEIQSGLYHFLAQFMACRPRDPNNPDRGENQRVKKICLCMSMVLIFFVSLSQSRGG
jgi:hypothetical protein